MFNQEEPSMRLRMTAVFASMVLSLVAVSAAAREMVLAEDGKTPCQIVVSENASLSTQHAARELQEFLQQMSGARLNIVSDRQTSGGPVIILGDNARFRELRTGIDAASLGTEGYVIRTVDDGHLVIVGSDARGVLYGVYGLLEDHLGCRWLAPDVSSIPKRARLVVGEIDDRQIPVLEYREIFLVDAGNPEWCVRNRLNAIRGHRLADTYGGESMAFAASVPFGHSFFSLVPPTEYFDSHPEYFSMIGGMRVKDCQLCCTNPDVIRICTERIREAMRKEPKATVFSVSQQDTHRSTNFSVALNRWVHYCECTACQTLAAQEESQTAPVLHLVNSVAAAVREEFPGKVVETLAYRWSQKPPKHMRPLPNVLIRLCPIDCCFSHPMATCDYGATVSFREDLKGWSRISERLWIWDYCTDFANYLLPFPNQKIVGANNRFYVECGVKGIFEQDCWQTAESELAALGAYVMAKSLWNPADCNTDHVINDFLNGYYGSAAVPIRRYIDAIHDRVQRENIHVYYKNRPDSPHLDDEFLAEADQLWQQAEELAANDPAVLHRVRVGRLSVDYAILAKARVYSLAKRPMTETLHALARRRFGPFFEVLKTSKFQRLKEAGEELDKDAYRRDLAKDLQIRE